MKAKNALLLALVCSIATISSIGLIAKFYFKAPSVAPRYTGYREYDREKRYNELSRKENLTKSEKQELKDLEEKLEKESKPSAPEEDVMEEELEKEKKPSAPEYPEYKDFMEEEVVEYR